MKKTNRKAFTLVEIVIVIAVIGILAGVMIPVFGGIIDSANKASDQSTAASLNVAISQKLDGINSADDLYDVVADTYVNVETAMTPKSANQGYHYWFNIDTNTVELKKYEELTPASGGSGTGSRESSGVTAASAVTVSNSAFANGKEYRLFHDKYFLLDLGGSVIGDALSALDGIDDAKKEEMIGKLNAVTEDSKHYDLAKALIDLLGKVSNVLDFKIVASGTGVQMAGNNVYVSYHINELTLSATEFDGSIAGITPSNEVKWSCESDFVSVDANGKVTISPAVVNNLNKTVEISATSKQNEDVIKTVVLNFIYPKNLEFIFNSKDYDMTPGADTDVELTVNKTVWEFAFSDLAPKFNNNEINVGCNADVVIEADGDSIFTIDKVNGQYVLKLKNLASYEGMTQTFTVKVGSGLVLEKTFTVSINDVSTEPYQLIEPFKTAEFLYRVGNGNAIPLRTFFNSTKPGNATLYIYDVAKSTTTTPAPIGATAGFTATVNDKAYTNSGVEIDATNWAETSIKFTGTGAAKIQIGDVAFVVEVVDGNNVIPDADGNTIVSSPAKGKNIVLLCDAKIADGGKINLNNSILFGNDFTLDVRNGNYSNGKYATDNYVVQLVDSTLNNVRIIGKAFNAFAYTADNKNNICNVYSTGNSVIANSYISGCAAPVRLAGGTLEVVGTTLSGGSLGNLDFRNGSLVLDNVTTINQKKVNNSPASEGQVGFGIVIWYEGVTSCQITIKNNLTQYNYLTKEDVQAISFGTGALVNGTTIATAVFDSSNAAFIYKDSNNVEWVNTGILSLTNAVGLNNFNSSNFNGEKDGTYKSQVVSNSGFDGFLYSVKKEKVKLSNPDEYVSAGQNDVKPSYTLNNSANNVPQASGSNVYCTMEGDEITISFDEGSEKKFKLEGFITASKLGKNLTLVNTYLDGVAVTNDSTLTFDAAGKYVLKFEFNDIYNYNIDGATRVEKREESVYITVYVVAATAKHAEFSFNGTAGNKVTASDGKTYVSADVNATSSSWGSISVDGKTIYYPIVNALVKKKNSVQSEYQAIFPVFKNVITITDYANAGTGDEVIYKDNGSSTVMPSGLTVVKGLEKNGGYTGDANFANVKDSALNYTGPTDVFQWSNGAGKGSATPKYDSDVEIYAYYSPENLGRSGKSYWIVQYSYTDNVGSTYYYYVGYIADVSKPAYTGSTGIGCFAEGSLVTLADGTHKPIEEITFEDQILAWDFNTGKYAVTVASLIDRYETSQQNVINLKFSDDTVVRMVVDHGFFDVDANKFVFLNEENVASYVGHTFVRASEDGTYENVELVGYEITVETVAYYSIQTAFYNNCIVDGMFTLCAPPDMIKYSDWFNYFEIGEGMKYDEEKMQADIEQYGLYTYEDFADYVTYEQFLAFNGPYLKVLVGRGVVTYDQIIELIGMYVNPEN